MQAKITGSKEKIIFMLKLEAKFLKVDSYLV